MQNLGERTNMKQNIVYEQKKLAPLNVGQNTKRFDHKEQRINILVRK